MTLRANHGRADLIIANNVMANVDDLPDFAEGIRTLLAPDGVFVFETGYLGSLVQNLVFDNIYHEHLSYFSVMTLIKLFADHGLELYDVEVIPTKGGSLRGFVQHVHGPHVHSMNAVTLLAREEQQELLNPWTYRAMGKKLLQIRRTLGDVVGSLHATGQRIAGYGASLSTVTLMAHFDLARYFTHIAEDNFVKHGWFMPGSRIPIKQPCSLTGTDYCVILPWRFADMIIGKHRDYREKGGRFIVPIPEVRIV